MKPHHSHLILFLTLALLSLSACNKEEPRSKRAAKPAHRVEVVTLSSETLGRVVELTGTLEAHRQVKIFNQEEGLIIELPFYEGDPVKQGERMVSLDPSLLQAQLDKARANTLQAKADLRRLRKLAAQQLTAEDLVVRAETALQVAEAEQAELETRLHHTRIDAPFDGVVSERLLSLNDIAPRHSHLLTLIDPHSLITKVAVSELILPTLNIGDPVELRIDALGKTSYQGVIERIFPTIDPATRLGWIEVRPTPMPAGARSGQLCRVKISSRRRERLMLPFSALRRDNEGDYIYRVIETKVVRTPVMTAERIGQRVEIVGGLAPGELVVVKGFLGLHDGSRVAFSTPQ